MTHCHTCPRCGGKGTVWSRTTGTVTCPECGGSGSALR
jgi:ribosomal protein S27E